jgi:hypothetical protein
MVWEPELRGNLPFSFVYRGDTTRTLDGLTARRLNHGAEPNRTCAREQWAWCRRCPIPLTPVTVSQS